MFVLCCVAIQGAEVEFAAQSPLSSQFVFGLSGTRTVSSGMPDVQTCESHAESGLGLGFLVAVGIVCIEIAGAVAVLAAGGSAVDEAALGLLGATVQVQRHLAPPAIRASPDCHRHQRKSAVAEGRSVQPTALCVVSYKSQEQASQLLARHGDML